MCVWNLEKKTKRVFWCKCSSTLQHTEIFTVIECCNEMFSTVHCTVREIERLLYAIMSGTGCRFYRTDTGSTLSVRMIKLLVGHGDGIITTVLFIALKKAKWYLWVTLWGRIRALKRTGL